MSLRNVQARFRRPNPDRATLIPPVTRPVIEIVNALTGLEDVHDPGQSLVFELTFTQNQDRIYAVFLPRAQATMDFILGFPNDATEEFLSENEMDYLQPTSVFLEKLENQFRRGLWKLQDVSTGNFHYGRAMKLEIEQSLLGVPRV